MTEFLEVTKVKRWTFSVPKLCAFTLATGCWAADAQSPGAPGLESPAHVPTCSQTWSCLQQRRCSSSICDQHKHSKGSSFRLHDMKLYYKWKKSSYITGRSQKLSRTQDGLSMLAWISYTLLLKFIFLSAFLIYWKTTATNNCVYC